MLHGFCVPLNKSLSDSVAQGLQLSIRGIALLLLVHSIGTVVVGCYQIFCYPIGHRYHFYQEKVHA